MTDGVISDDVSQELGADVGFRDDDVRRLQRSLPETTNLRAALQKLTSDHVDLVRSFVEGFDSRREFVRWGQRAAVLTLGELSGEWVAERAFSGLDMSVLVTSSARRRWVDEPSELYPLDRAADIRRGVVASDVLPACSSAVRRLRWSAVEYVSDEDDTLQPDPEVQEHPAMRPALTETHDRQRWALDRALEGFDSLDALTVWGQRLVTASYAEIPNDLVTRITVDEAETTRRYLVVQPEDEDHGPFFRESFAAAYLLPAFASAAREVADRAGELAEQEHKEPKDKRL